MGARDRSSIRRNLSVTEGLRSESKAVSTSGKLTTDEEDGKEVDAEDRACYRSWTMRASSLSQDRCELQFAVKELAKRMQQPITKNMQALKRLVRFLKGSPRCLVVYNRQAEQPTVDVFLDSDWAGCAKTRRSTSSSYVMLGGHIFAASANTQNVVATSSGEAEFNALTKNASRAQNIILLLPASNSRKLSAILVHRMLDHSLNRNTDVFRYLQSFLQFSDAHFHVFTFM